MIWIVTIPIIGLLIFLSAFFAAAEMAFVSVDRIKVRGESKKGNRKAVLLEKMLEKPDEVISAIVIGNNFVNITASILAGTTAAYLFGSIGVGIATAVMTLVIVIFGEATPKAFGIHNESFAFHVSRPLFVIRKIFYPLVKAFAVLTNAFLRMVGKEKRGKSLVTEEEIKAMLDLGVEHGTIKSDEKKLVEEIFDFDETEAKEVHVPVKEIVGLQEDDPLKKLVKKATETGYSRFPVYRENKDDIIGIAHVKDALLKDENKAVKEIMKSVLKISPKMKVDDVLREMQRRKVHMAVIQSKDGTTMGLVTLEDLIEEVFGEIKDEHDTK